MTENDFVRKEGISDKEFDLICEYIKIRNESNISQRQLAKLTGMAQSTIARVETNVCKTSLVTFINMLDALGYHIELKKNK